MGKRYYCDYCERSFPDTADNRKKHITGVFHQRQKKTHYDGYRDAATILAEELTKKPCRRFQQTGSCDFGSVCRFLHRSPEDMRQLEQQAHLEKVTKKPAETAVPVVDDCILNAWIEKVSKQSDSQVELPRSEVALGIESWKMPTDLKFVSDIPPSLCPPTFSDIVEFGSKLEWG